MKSKRMRCPALGKGFAACCSCKGIILGFVVNGRTIIRKYEDGRIIKGMCIDLMGAEEPGIYPGQLDEITDGETQ